MENEKMNPEKDFAVGSTVIYGTHGKCVIRGIEAREVNGDVIPFYKLEVQKPPLSRSTRTDPSIWLPVTAAPNRGLRAPMDQHSVAQVMEILASPEYFFPLQETWTAVFPKLEKTICAEGAVGLAKVFSYLAGLKRKLVLLPAEISRFEETVHKLFLRELAEALGQQIKTTEEQVNKLLRKKVITEH